MSLPNFKIALANIPFLTQNYVIQDDKQLIDIIAYNQKKYPTLDIANLSSFNINKDNSIEFTYQFDEGIIAALGFNRYNAVYLSHEHFLSTDSANWSIYEIQRIQYLSAFNARIKAVPSFYTIIRDTTPDALTIIPKYYSPSKDLKSHVTFVEKGYAYDSLVDSNGVTKYTTSGNNDLYARVSNPPMPFLKKATKLKQFDGAYEEYILGYVVIYTLPVDFESNDPLPYLTSSNISTPYSCYVLPVLKEGDVTRINAPIGTTSGNILTANHLQSFITTLGEKAASILNIKFYAYSSLYHGQFTSSVSGIYLMLTGSPFTDCKFLPVTIDSVEYNVIVPYELNNVIFLRDFDFSDWNLPKCSRGAHITSDDLNNINENPFIVGNTNEFVISDLLGTQYGGNFNRFGTVANLLFKMHQNWSPEPSFISVDVLNSNSIQANILSDKMQQFVSSSSYTISFALDRMQEFLANNTNFYELNNTIKRYMQNMRNANIAETWVNGTLNQVGAAVQLVSSGKGTINMSSSTLGMTASTAFQLYRSHQEIQLFETKNRMYLENLASAPDKLVGCDSNILSVLANFSPAIYACWYTCDDLTKEQMLKEFIYYGIELNKFVENGEKYFTITENKFDKVFSKYFKGSTELYVNTAPPTSQYLVLLEGALATLEQKFMNGSRLVKWTTGQGGTETYDYAPSNQILKTLNEEVFR